MCRFGFLDEEDSLWVNHLRGRDMLEARGGGGGSSRSAAKTGSAEWENGWRMDGEWMVMD